MRIRVAEAVEDAAELLDRVPDAPQLAGGDEVRHEHERDRRAVEDDVVVVQPLGHVPLQARTAVAELGELEQVLEL